MNIGPSPFAWLAFDKDGALIDPEAMARVNEIANRDGITDLVIIAHGWNNDLDNAQAFYRTLWRNASAALEALDADPASFAVIGILWPAKSYDARYDGAELYAGESGSGGSLSVDGDVADAETDAPHDHLESMLAQVRAFVGDDQAFDRLEQAARRALDGTDETAPLHFFQTAKTVLGYDPEEPDPELRQDASQFRRTETSDDASLLLAAFSSAKTIDIEPGTGAAQSLGSAVRSIFSGARSGVTWALNKLTYYTMKKRAGVVGEALAGTFAGLRVERALRLHLVGHSFGARLVTAAAAALPDIPRLEFRSLTLLQGAYSHNGLTDGKGPFAKVVGKPTGPISFTHTHNDKACTIAYPIASRLVLDSALGLGDANDPYGAMGANGPRLTGEMMAPDCATTQFAPAIGKINRFLADSYVVKTADSDAHNNVANAQCGQLVAAAITA